MQNIHKTLNYIWQQLA